MSWLTSSLSEEIINNADFHERSPEIAKDILSNACTVTQLIERLAGALTNKDAVYRAQGTLVLSKVLTDLPPEYLDKAQLKVIVNFYIDRLRDHHGVIPAVVTGLLALSNTYSLIDEDAARICMALFKEVPCQQQVREDRFKIYMMIDNFLRNKPTDLVAIGPDFVTGFISAMDGERDPRNLILLFTMLPGFLQTVPLGHLVEEMFEVISCYFPVDFNQSAKEPSAIGRDDLADKLCPCLYAIPSFHSHCLPLVVEKLESNLKLAKVDSLKLLAESTKVFEAVSYEPHLPHIWSLLQKEFSNRIDEELRKCASDALMALLVVLSQSNEQRKLFEGFLQRILIAMELILADATAKPVFQIVGAVYLSCLRATKQSCLFLMVPVLNSLARFYKVTQDNTLKISVLRTLSNVYEAIDYCNVNIEYNFDDISKCCMEACMGNGENLKFAGLSTTTALAKVIPKDKIKDFGEIMRDNVSYKLRNKPISKQSRLCILSLSKYHPNELFIVEHWKLHSGDAWTQEIECLFLDRVLAFCALLLNDTLTFKVMDVLMTFINERSDYTLCTLEALKVTVEDSDGFDANKIAEIENKFHLVESVLDWTFENIQSIELSNVSTKFIETFMRFLPADAQLALLDKNLLRFLLKFEKGIRYVGKIFYALMAPLRADVCPNYLPRIIQNLCTIVLGYHSGDLGTQSSILIANILNKTYVRKDRENFQLLFSIAMAPLYTLTHLTVDLFSWLTKGCALCGYCTDELILKLTSLLEDDTLGSHAAKGIQVIMTDSADLSAANYCGVTYLYKQRIFEAFLKSIPPVSNTSKESVFLAWAYVCENVPRILLKRVPQLHFIVTQSLGHKNMDIIFPTLSTLSYLVQNKDPELTNSFRNILQKLIVLSSYQQSMEIRIKSLELIYNIAEDYDNMLLLPYKQDMLYSWLVTQLDDRKRLVRNAAVKARTRWYLIGAPGEDK